MSGLQARGLGSKYKSGKSHLEMFSEGMRLDEIFEKGRGVVSRASDPRRGHLDAQIVLQGSGTQGSVGADAGG